MKPGRRRPAGSIVGSSRRALAPPQVKILRPIANPANSEINRPPDWPRLSFYKLILKFCRRKLCNLKKAKPLDGLLRERPAWHDLPAPNPVRPGPGPEDRLRTLQRRFRAVSARHDRASKRRYYRSAKIAALAAIVAFAVVWGLGSSPWPVTITLRHVASAPNCGFARLVGLAPARRGEPGYWKRHDRDRDGIACEPWPLGRGRGHIRYAP
jgi:hypothetical protein